MVVGEWICNSDAALKRVISLFRLFVITYNRDLFRNDIRHIWIPVANIQLCIIDYRLKIEHDSDQNVVAIFLPNEYGKMFSGFIPTELIRSTMVEL